MAEYNSGRGQNGCRQVRGNQPLVYNHQVMLKEIRDNLKHLRREPEGQSGSEGKETDVKMSFTSTTNGLPPALHMNQRVNQQRYPPQRNNFGEPRRVSLEPMQANRTYDESGYSSSSSECSSLSSANDLNGGQQFVGNVQNMPFYNEDQMYQGLFPSNFDFVRAMTKNDGFQRINPNASVSQRREMAGAITPSMQLHSKSPPPYGSTNHLPNMATRSDHMPMASRSDHMPMVTRSDHMPIRSDHMPMATRSDHMPMVTRSDHMPIRSDHVPMVTRSDHMPMPVRSDHMPIRSDHMPIRSDHMPIRSDHMASMTSKVETSKYMQKTALPSGSTTISQAEWKVTTGPEITTRGRSPVPFARPVLQDGGAVWKTRPYSIGQKPPPNQGNYHMNPYNQQSSSQQLTTPQFQVQVSLNAPNVAPATINPPNMNPVVSKNSGHSATFRVSVQTSPVSMTTEREAPEPRFPGMQPSGYPTAMARPEAVMDYRDSPGASQYDYQPPMTSSNNGFIQSFSSSKPHPKQHPPPYVPVAHRPPPPCDSSESSFTSYQSNESDMRSVPERTSEHSPNVLRQWSHRNVDSVDAMSVSSSGSESHSSTVEEEEFPEFDHASFASQEDEEEVSATTYKNSTGTLLVHFRNRPTLDINERNNSPASADENTTNGKSDQNRKTTPQAYKFFIEQRVENVFKENKQREQRRLQLDEEMRKVQLSEEAQFEMRKILYQKETNHIRLKRTKMDQSMFQKLQTIGVGAFGEVCLTRHVQSGSLYAMKILKKAEVLKRNQAAHVKAERDLLAEADNEWVVKLFYSFQDKDHLYFVMEYVPGGDLMSLLIKFGVFTEDMARFYIAELVLAVEYVHKMGFIHRDIKPDNVLIDSEGHIKLTDFGLCTGFRWTHDSKYYQCGTLPRNHNSTPSADLDDGTWAKERKCRCGHAVDGKKPLARRHIRQHMRCQAHSLVGTPNYIAPEVLMRVPYTHLCDWWSVGVILYEMLVGQPPFYAPNAGETQMKVINWETTLQIPIQAKLTSEAEELILQLCNSANQRLGIGGVDEIKNHPFFHGIDWVMIRRTTANYVPHIRHPEDTSNFDPVEPERPPSGDSASMTDVDEMAKPKHPSHAFYEFTFRRFFNKDQARSSVSNYSSWDETEADENKAPVFV